MKIYPHWDCPPYKIEDIGYHELKVIDAAMELFISSEKREPAREEGPYVGLCPSKLQRATAIHAAIRAFLSTGNL